MRMTAANASCNDRATTIDSPARFCRQAMEWIDSWLIDVLIPMTVRRRIVQRIRCVRISLLVADYNNKGECEA